MCMTFIRSVSTPLSATIWTMYVSHWLSIHTECEVFSDSSIYQITNFLNKPEVMEDLGVNRTWEACRELEELLVS